MTSHDGTEVNDTQGELDVAQYARSPEAFDFPAPLW